MGKRGMASDADAELWRTRAEQLRLQAAQMIEPTARVGMIILAEQYELLAEHSRQIAGDVRLEQHTAAARSANDNKK